MSCLQATLNALDRDETRCFRGANQILDLEAPFDFPNKPYLPPLKPHTHTPSS